MSEAETRSAKLPDVIVEDFIRFCEYAYRGDYTVPSFAIEEEPMEDGIHASKNPPPNPPMVAQNLTNIFGNGNLPPTHSPLKPRKTVVPDSPPKCLKTELRTMVHGRDYLSKGDLKSKILKGFRPQSNTASNEVFTPVFLAHARLYTFANARFAGQLKALTLHKLQQTLKAFQLDVKRVGDVIELAKYAYSNEHTPDRKSDGTIDDLRRLVVEYIACEIDTIGKCDGFVELMEEGGEFVGDFWGIARKYLI